MNELDITTPDGLSPLDAIKHVRDDGKEYWSARDLQQVVKYVRWEDFTKIVARAMASAGNSGHDVPRSFAEVTEKPEGGGRPRQDYLLSRFGAYLTVMNGDPNMPRVAEAQAYFAIKTREAEAAPHAGMPAIPADFASALEEAARQVRRADAAETKALELEAKVEADAPKIAYIDTFVADSDLLRLRTIASNLNVQETWLRQLLVVKEWIYAETDTRWSNSQERKVTTVRYSAYADHKRYFRPVEVHEAPRFKGEVMHTLKVTILGAEAIARLVTKETQS